MVFLSGKWANNVHKVVLRMKYDNNVSFILLAKLSSLWFLDNPSISRGLTRRVQPPRLIQNEELIVRIMGTGKTVFSSAVSSASSLGPEVSRAGSQEGKMAVK